MNRLTQLNIQPTSNHPSTPTRRAVLAHSLFNALPSFNLCARGDAHRPALEQSIRRQFQVHYTAEVSHFAPLLLQMEDLTSSDSQHQTQAIVGLRAASAGPLFLESYLDAPIEQELTHRLNVPVARDRLLEIGNLVSLHPGSSALLFLVMTAIAKQAGYQWLVFTATPQVNKIIRRLNADPIILRAADGNRLGLEVDKWGSYYHRTPQVTAIPVCSALEAATAAPWANQMLDRFRPTITRLAARLAAVRPAEAVQ